MGSQASPFELAVGIPEVYIAPVGEAFPDLSAAVAGNWEKIVDRELTPESGVIIRANESVVYDPFRTAGVTAPIASAVEQESFEVEVPSLDFTAPALARAIHGPAATITDTAAGSGVAGNKNFQLYGGPRRRSLAVLIRWPYSTEATSEDDDFAMQVEIPLAGYQRNMEATFTKANPAMYALVFTALYDLATGAFVRFRLQDAAAT